MAKVNIVYDTVSKDVEVAIDGNVLGGYVKHLTIDKYSNCDGDMKGYICISLSDTEKMNKEPGEISSMLTVTASKDGVTLTDSNKDMLTSKYFKDVLKS